MVSKKVHFYPSGGWSGSGVKLKLGHYCIYAIVSFFSPQYSPWSSFCGLSPPPAWLLRNEFLLSILTNFFGALVLTKNIQCWIKHKYFNRKLYWKIQIRKEFQCSLKQRKCSHCISPPADAWINAFECKYYYVPQRAIAQDLEYPESDLEMDIITLQRVAPMIWIAWRKKFWLGSRNFVTSILIPRLAWNWYL